MWLLLVVGVSVIRMVDDSVMGMCSVGVILKLVVVMASGSVFVMDGR